MTLIWGSTFAAVKIVMREIPAVQLIAVRFTLAALVLLVLFRGRIFPLTMSQIVKGSVLGLFLFFGFVAQNFGLLSTTASKSAFITALMVVVVPLLQFAIEHRAPKLGNVLGVIVVVGGLWFLTSPAGSSFNIGDALTLLCAVLFGVYIVYLDVVSGDMSAVQLTFLQVASMAVYSVACSAAFEPWKTSYSTGLVLSLVYLSIFATLITTYVQTRFQKETTPTRAVIIFTIEPVFASIIAYFLLGEQIGALGILGGALILAGVLLSELSDAIPFLNKALDPQEGA